MLNCGTGVAVKNRNASPWRGDKKVREERYGPFKGGCKRDEVFSKQLLEKFQDILGEKADLCTREASGIIDRA
jgi:hypothetical protein